MGTIHNLAERFKALNFDLVKQESLQETAPSIFPELNRQQLRQGQLSTGNLITPKLSSLKYAANKLSTGGLAPFLTPDLFKIGNFQSRITTTVSAKSIDTDSTDEKSAKLEGEYTPLIFGLNNANLAKYANQDLQPVLFEKLKAATVGV